MASRKTRIGKAWMTIETELAQIAPEILHSLRKGATDRAIKRLESRLGFRPPADYLMSAQIHDGQKNASLRSFPLLSYEFLLPIREVISQWEMMKELSERGHFEDYVPLPSRGAVNLSTWWNERWIPVTDIDGDKLCIDMDPARRGVKGQVIYFDCYGRVPRTRKAHRFLDLLEDFAKKLVAKRFYLSELGTLLLKSDKRWP